MLLHRDIALNASLQVHSSAANRLTIEDVFPKIAQYSTPSLAPVFAFVPSLPITQRLSKSRL